MVEPDSSPGTVKLLVTISTGTDEAIREMASKRGCKRQDVVREALHSMLEGKGKGTWAHSDFHFLLDQRRQLDRQLSLRLGLENQFVAKKKVQSPQYAYRYVGADD